MAPEMLQRKRYSGEAVDVWSLGVLCYTLIYGEMPFEEDSEAQTRIKVLTQEPTYPDSEINGPALELIKLMLSKDPRQRPTLTEILQSSWLGSEGEAQLEILNEREYPPFTSKSEKRLLRIFRAAQFDTESIRESVSQSKCDALAGTWALALRRELKIENRRARHRSSGHHHNHIQQYRNSLNFSKQSLSRHGSANSKASVLRKNSSSSRRSSSIGRANSSGRYSQQFYATSNSSNLGFGRSTAELTVKESSSYTDKSALNENASANNTKTAKHSKEENDGNLVSSRTRESSDLGHAKPQPRFWHSTDENESDNSQEQITFQASFSRTDTEVEKDTDAPPISPTTHIQRPVSEYNPSGPISTSDSVSPHQHNAYPNTSSKFKENGKRTLQDIFKGSFHGHHESTLNNRSSISLPIPGQHSGPDQYLTPQFVNVTDNQNGNYTNSAFIPVPPDPESSNSHSSDHILSEEASSDAARKGGKHGWNILHSSSKSSHSTVSSSHTNESSSNNNVNNHYITVTSPEKKNKKFVTAMKNAWMKIVPGSVVNKKRSGQLVGQRESIASSLYAVGFECNTFLNAETKDSTISIGDPLENDQMLNDHRDDKVGESKSVGNIKVAYNELPNSMDTNTLKMPKAKSPTTPSRSRNNASGSAQNTPRSAGKDSFVSSKSHNDDTITSLLPNNFGSLQATRQDSYASAGSTNSQKSSSANVKNNTASQLYAPNMSMPPSGPGHFGKQRPTSQISQFSTLSGISQASGASSRVSSSFDRYSFSELSSITGVTAAASTAQNGSHTPRRHHSTDTPVGNISSSQYLRRPYMGRRSTSSSFSSIQSYNTSRGAGSNIPNPGTNGSTFMKSHRKSHSKSSSLSSLSIHSGFLSNFTRDDLSKPRNRSNSSPYPFYPKSGSQSDGTGNSDPNTSFGSGGNTPMTRGLSSEKLAGSLFYSSSRSTHHRRQSSNGGGTSSSSLQYPPSSAKRMASPDSVRSLNSSRSIRSLRSTGSSNIRRKSSAQRLSRNQPSSRASSLSRNMSQNSKSKGRVSRTGSYNMSRGQSSRRSSISSRASSISSISSSGYRRRSLSANGGFVSSSNEGPSSSSSKGINRLSSSQKSTSLKKRRPSAHGHFGASSRLNSLNKSNSDLHLMSSLSASSNPRQFAVAQSPSSKHSFFSNKGGTKPNSPLSSSPFSLENAPQRPGSPFVSQRDGAASSSRSSNSASKSPSTSSSLHYPSSAPLPKASKLSSLAVPSFRSNDSLGSKFSRAVRRSNTSGASSSSSSSSSSPGPPQSSYRSRYPGATPSSLAFPKASSRFGTLAGLSTPASSRRLGDTRMPGSLLSKMNTVGDISSSNGDADSADSSLYTRGGGGFPRQGSVILEGEEEETSSFKEIEEEKEDEEK